MPEDRIDLWRASLSIPSTQLRIEERILSLDEKKRAERFHFERDRRRFIACRAVLRRILGRYLGSPPSELRIHYGTNGKPAIADLPPTKDLRFNLSHSHELALYAFTLNEEIGVDLEYRRALSDADRIVERFFSKKEYASLQTLSEDQREEAFFNGWTRKEAYLKALGKGLQKPLNEFEVPLGRLSTAVAVKEVSGRPTEWTIRSLVPDVGYIGAVVSKGGRKELFSYQWHF